MAEQRTRPWLGAAATVRRDEWPFAAAMAFYFFIVITTFWILKPLKKGLFIEHYDVQGLPLLGLQLDAAQAELLAKVLNMVVAAVAVVVFSVLSRRLRRERLAIAFIAFFAAGFGVYAWLLPDAGAGTVWTFYLYGDLFSSLMVASFFAFLNDSVSSGAAKRLYGLVGLGGVVGGVAGSMGLALWVEQIEPSAWMRVCIALALVLAATAWGAARLARRLPPGSRSRDVERPAPDRTTGSDALRGARLTVRSTYLMAIVAIVGLYEIVSTAMDFQFSSAVQHFLDGDAIGAHFSRVYAITNGAALFIQLFVTSFVMTRVGVGAALLVLPVALFGGSAAFLVAPMLWSGSLLNVCDGAFAYSINQSSKESLYVPTTPEEKYQAKAFIDMWVQRTAKAIAVVGSLAFTLWFPAFDAVRWLSVGSIGLLLVWIPAARHAGRRFERHERDAEAGGPAETPPDAAAPDHAAPERPARGRPASWSG